MHGLLWRYAPLRVSWYITEALCAVQLNWVVAYSSSDAGNSNMGEPFDNYIIALYWSVMTMSTIGYGDVSPKTRYERIYEIFGMILGASVYAYMVGAICSIVASMNAVSAEFNQQMDRWVCVSFSWSGLCVSLLILLYDKLKTRKGVACPCACVTRV